MAQTSHLTRGRLRATWFDLTIGAGRLEMIAQYDVMISGDMKAKLRAKAARMRVEAADTLQFLTDPERLDLENATRERSPAL